MTKNIEEWKIERRTLFLEEQELLKATETFFVQSNQLLEFCKDCHNAFLKGNAEMRRKIIQIVCSNFYYFSVKFGNDYIITQSGNVLTFREKEALPAVQEIKNRI